MLTEFADLQCPFCRDYAVNVLPQVIERYVRTKKLRLELRLRCAGHWCARCNASNWASGARART